MRSQRWLLAALLVCVVAGCTSDGEPRTVAPGPLTESRTATAPSRSVMPSTSALSSRSSGPNTSPAPSSSAARGTGVATPTSTRSRPTVPPVSAKADAAGLIDIRTIVPGGIVDLRYATTHNFTGIRLYPVGARCLVHESMAPGLAVAAQRLRQVGLRLVFWDCYRPHSVQVRMFEVVPDPNWVARPGPYARSHEAGRSVDVTLARPVGSGECPAARRVQGYCLLDMGTRYDDFTPRAYAFATDGVSARAQADRARLREAMNAGGIIVYSGEWWHFDGPGADVARPHLNAPVD